MVKEHLGGNISNWFPLPPAIWNCGYYDSTSMGSAKKIIHYFDKYHLQSKKHIGYLRWRKVYRLIQDKEHLTKMG